MNRKPVCEESDHNAVEFKIYINFHMIEHVLNTD